jgi:hypothetical protein
MQRALLLASALAGALSCKGNTPSVAAVDSGGTTIASPGSAQRLPEVQPLPSPAAGTSLSDFEGAIAARSKNATNAKDATPDMLFLVKGGKLRLDTPAPEGKVAHSIFDSTTKTVTVILDAQKMALEMPMPVVSQAAAAGPVPVVTHTGKLESVAGYSCEDWDVMTGKKHEVVCVAKGVPFFDFAAMAPQAGGAGQSWADALRDAKGFPLRAIEVDAAGTEVSRMEVTKVTRRPLDAELFLPPKGFNVMRVPGLGTAPMPHP